MIELDASPTLSSPLFTSLDALCRPFLQCQLRILLVVFYFYLTPVCQIQLGSVPACAQFRVKGSSTNVTISTFPRRIISTYSVLPTKHM